MSSQAKGLPNGKGTLYDEDCGGGNARQGHQGSGGLCDGGRNARHLHQGHDGIPGGGLYARQEHQGQKDGLVNQESVLKEKATLSPAKLEPSGWKKNWLD